MHSPKQDQIRKFNDAYLSGDIAYIVDQVTENVVWHIAGEATVEGKEAFAKAHDEMKNTPIAKLKIHHIVTHGKLASVNGSMQCQNSKGELLHYEFCDVYRFNSFKNAKISEIDTYMVRVEASQSKISKP